MMIHQQNNKLLHYFLLSTQYTNNKYAITYILKYNINFKTYCLSYIDIYYLFSIIEYYTIDGYQL